MDERKAALAAAQAQLKEYQTEQKRLQADLVAEINGGKRSDGSEVKNPGDGPSAKRIRQQIEALSPQVQSQMQNVMTLQSMQGPSEAELADKQLDREAGERSSLYQTGARAVGFAAGAGATHFALKKALKSRQDKERKRATRANVAGQRIENTLESQKANKLTVKNQAKVQGLVDDAFDAGGMRAPFGSPGMRTRNGGAGLFRKSLAGRLASTASSTPALAMGVGGAEAAGGYALQSNPDVSDGLRTAGALSLGMGMGVAGMGAKDLYVNPPGADPVQPNSKAIGQILEGRNRAALNAPVAPGRQGILAAMMNSKAARAVGPVGAGAGMGAMLMGGANDAQAALTGQDVDPQTAQGREDAGMQAGAVAGGAVPLAARYGGPLVRGALSAGSKLAGPVGAAYGAYELGNLAAENLDYETQREPEIEEILESMPPEERARAIMALRMQQMQANRVAQ